MNDDDSQTICEVGRSGQIQAQGGCGTAQLEASSGERQAGKAKKQCQRCLQEKPCSEFYRQTAARDGLQNWCRVCHKEFDDQHYRAIRNRRQRDKYLLNREAEREKQRAYYATHKSVKSRYSRKWYAANKSAVRNYNLRRNYGISEAKFTELFEAQGGRCKICGSDNPNHKDHKFLHVDHCHESGTVRGLLCNKCNHLLGLCGDDPSVLRKAITYLTKKNTKKESANAKRKRNVSQQVPQVV